jgi:hypothetical protein
MPRKEKLDIWKLLIFISFFLSVINTYYIFTSFSTSTVQKFTVPTNTTSTFPTGQFILAYSPLAISIVFSLAVVGFLIYRVKVL